MTAALVASDEACQIRRSSIVLFALRVFRSFARRAAVAGFAGFVFAEEA